MTKSFTKRQVPAAVRAAVLAAQAKKGEDIVVLDLRAVSTFTDFFVILHGNSARQNGALADAIGADLKARGERPMGVEGVSHGEWVLLDYGNFIVHVFSRAAREHYALEKLWGDAPKVAY
jgi:ribosome-associated protein